ncbi:MAG TPA: hypothetical protein VNL77_10300 [Roseiflexaceae bacterium]|nr:hypothetical protein [Roseiflexaceae bacterium]
MAPKVSFNPERLGFYEKAGWEAYYDRDWPRVLRLMVRLNREQFRMPWPTAVAAALDTVRASVAFAPRDNDLPETKRHLERFYHKARRSVDMRADAATLAALELDYWLVHRELAARRKVNRADDDIEPMVRSLANLHAALFDSTPERMRVSAELRALAAVAVDRITGRYSEDVAADWRRVEALLAQAYRAVLLALDRAPTPGAERAAHS